MSLDKAIAAGKERRRPRRRAARWDPACRNHGACSYCRENRTKAKRLAERVKDLERILFRPEEE